MTAIYEDLKDKRIFITGHTGFKGIWLTSVLLSFGAKITGLSLNDEKKKLLTLHTCMGYEFSNGECPEPESSEIINENTFSDDNRIFSGINTAIASSANTQTLGGGKRTKRRRRSKIKRIGINSLVIRKR